MDRLLGAATPLALGSLEFCVSSLSTLRSPVSPPQAIQPWSRFHDTQRSLTPFGMAICSQSVGSDHGQGVGATDGHNAVSNMGLHVSTRPPQTDLLAKVDEHGDCCLATTNCDDVLQVVYVRSPEQS